VPTVEPTTRTMRLIVQNAASCCAEKENNMLAYKGFVDYSQALVKAADAIGLARDILNKKLNEQEKKYSREKELNVNGWGVLGELVAMKFLDERSIEYEHAPLIAPTPVKRADIVMDGIKYDVKAVPPGGRQFMVNEEAHEQKDVDYYWFVQFSRSMRGYVYAFKHCEISDWGLAEPVQANRTAHYYKDIEHIR